LLGSLGKQWAYAAGLRLELIPTKPVQEMLDLTGLHFMFEIRENTPVGTDLLPVREHVEGRPSVIPSVLASEIIKLLVAASSILPNLLSVEVRRPLIAELRLEVPVQSGSLGRFYWKNSSMSVALAAAPGKLLTPLPSSISRSRLSC
jgi:hypothetical protein